MVPILGSVTLIFILIQKCSSFFFEGIQRSSFRFKTSFLFSDISNQHENYQLQYERRLFLKSIPIVGMLSSLISSSPARSEEDTTITPNQQRILSLLRPIPVFTIVDSAGIPFMVVGEDAKISCYFFTTFAEANRLLSLARDSVDQEIEKSKGKDQNENVENPWKQGRISSVPLDFAVRLVKKGKIGGAYFYLAPADEDVEDALTLTPELQEQGLREGQVPLFYMDDFTIEKKNISTSNPIQECPLFFRKKELVHQWKKYHPTDVLEPPIKVTELSAVLKLILSSSDKEDKLRSLILIPPSESERKAKECLAQMGKNEPFQLGKRILVL